jgi:hypothetical protein
MQENESKGACSTIKVLHPFPSPVASIFFEVNNLSPARHQELKGSLLQTPGPLLPI